MINTFKTKQPLLYLLHPDELHCPAILKQTLHYQKMQPHEVVSSKYPEGQRNIVQTHVNQPAPWQMLFGCAFAFVIIKAARPLYTYHIFIGSVMTWWSYTVFLSIKYFMTDIYPIIDDFDDFFCHSWSLFCLSSHAHPKPGLRGGGVCHTLFAQEHQSFDQFLFAPNLYIYIYIFPFFQRSKHVFLWKRKTTTSWSSFFNHSNLSLIR